jgi:hypothetical protein
MLAHLPCFVPDTSTLFGVDFLANKWAMSSPLIVRYLRLLDFILYLLYKFWYQFLRPH